MLLSPIQKHRSPRFPQQKPTWTPATDDTEFAGRKHAWTTNENNFLTEEYKKFVDAGQRPNISHIYEKIQKEQTNNNWTYTKGSVQAQISRLKLPQKFPPLKAFQPSSILSGTQAEEGHQSALQPGVSSPFVPVTREAEAAKSSDGDKGSKVDPNWTPEEDQFLEEKYKEYYMAGMRVNIPEISSAMVKKGTTRTDGAVQKRISRLKLPKKYAALKPERALLVLQEEPREEDNGAPIGDSVSYQPSERSSSEEVADSSFRSGVTASTDRDQAPSSGERGQSKRPTKKTPSRNRSRSEPPPKRHRRNSLEKYFPRARTVGETPTRVRIAVSGRVVQSVI